ncbi:MAG: YgfZ/GcvT domain-containing protein [Methyloligellaceae bacterium]
MKRLTFYKLRADVAIEKCPDLQVVATSQPEVIAAFNPVISFSDPRFEPLGYRFITTPENIEAGNGSIDRPLDDENSYHHHRIHLAVPEGGMDFAFGSVFPHDVSMDVLHGVHFQKGCFIGQEVVSRMQHRQKNRKSIVRVRMAKTINPELISDDEVRPNLTTSEGRKIGILGSVLGQEGLAIIRIDHAQKAIAENISILIEDTEIELQEPAWASYQLRPQT